MKFHRTPISGVLLVEPERHGDDRGWFMRTYCEQVFADNGLNTHWPQSNASFNRQRGTLRGLHWQADPDGEIKLLRCPRGLVFDVVADLRVESPSYRKWFSVELGAENGHMLYIPRGIAHGFQTLEDNTELVYLMGSAYVAGGERGVRWDDPAFAIAWPLSDPILSPRDAALPHLDQIETEAVSC